MSELTPNEKCLSCIAFLVVTASIALALCIGFILPRAWTTEGYANKDDAEKRCGCGLRKITTNYINCIPRSFSNRVLQRKNDTADKSGEVCELVQDYPYVVSLNVDAYDDDNRERRLACTGTILSKDWVLIGEDCIFEENEFSALKLRAGSTYWSKEGTEYLLGAIAKFGDEGPTAVKVVKPFKFGKYVSPVRISRKGKYTTWISSVSVGWNKGQEKKYQKFVVQKWSTTPCTDHCHIGEVMGNPTCSTKKFDRALVAENRLLVGLRSGVCNNGNATKIMFADVQTEEYQNWFEFLLGHHEELNGTNPLPVLERDLMGTTASPLDIYEFNACVATESNNEKNEDVTDASVIRVATKNPTEPIQKTKPTKTTKETLINLKTSSTKTEPTTPKTTEQTQITKIITTTDSSSTTTSSSTTAQDESETTTEKTETTEITTTTQQETSTEDINPTMFPPLFGKSKTLAPLAFKIDQADEYEDNDSGGGGNPISEENLLMPLV